MKLSFSGKTVLVTGGTRGIGRQIAKDFLSCGARVIITGTKKTKNTEFPGMKGCDYISVDFSDRESLNAFIKSIRKMKRVDVCVNNAGINRINPIGATKEKDYKDITMVNIEAPLLITREVSKKMKKNKFGRIVNIGSILGVISKEKRAVYSMTKHALVGLTQAVSNELARYNVLVNTLSPGFVLTDMTKNILSKKEIKELSAKIPARRFAVPRDISKTVLFLASEHNTYLTGKNIIVDGGFIDV